MEKILEKKSLFSFKQKSFDFIVEEKLPFKLDGKGDALFVYFEKQNKTTMEILDFLCKELKISRLTLGVAGLKDKDAITRQWISIYQSALKKM
jgi:tRNA pseudouridine13 synthase